MTLALISIKTSAITSRAIAFLSSVSALFLLPSSSDFKVCISRINKNIADSIGYVES